MHTCFWDQSQRFALWPRLRVKGIVICVCGGVWHRIVGGSCWEDEEWCNGVWFGLSISVDPCVSLSLRPCLSVSLSHSLSLSAPLPQFICLSASLACSFSLFYSLSLQLFLSSLSRWLSLPLARSLYLSRSLSRSLYKHTKNKRTRTHTWRQHKSRLENK